MDSPLDFFEPMGNVTLPGWRSDPSNAFWQSSSTGNGIKAQSQHGNPQWVSQGSKMIFCPKKLEDAEMSRKAMPMTGIPEGFALTEKTVALIGEKFPAVNIEGTLERFIESAQAHGRMYADWQAAFRTWVRKAVENKWDGVEYKQGKAQDPRWLSILNEVRPYGFRVPHPLESPGAYRTSFEIWKRQQEAGTKIHDRAPLLDFGNVLKKVQ